MNNFNICNIMSGICSQIPAEWHFIMAALFIILVGVPVANILHRAGHSRWWTIIAFLPLLNLIGLWVFAFTRWPKVRSTH